MDPFGSRRNNDGVECEGEGESDGAVVDVEFEFEVEEFEDDAVLILIHVEEIEIGMEERVPDSDPAMRWVAVMARDRTGSPSVTIV